MKVERLLFKLEKSILYIGIMGLILGSILIIYADKYFSMLCIISLIIILSIFLIRIYFVHRIILYNEKLVVVNVFGVKKVLFPTDIKKVTSNASFGGLIKIKSANNLVLRISLKTENIAILLNELVKKGYLDEAIIIKINHMIPDIKQ